MTKQTVLLFAALLSVAALRADQPEELKAYYEQQKAEILPTFVAPELGNEVTVTLATGAKRTGILMKLNAKGLELMTGAGMVAYAPDALADSSRAWLFAEDFAHAKAMEKTQEYKQQLFIERVEQEHAGIHSGSLSVSSQIKRDAKRDVQRQEKENRKTGAVSTITRTTKTQTETYRLDITVANNAIHPDRFKLSWYFLSRTVTGDRVTIHDRGSQEVEVGARNRERIRIDSNAYIQKSEEMERRSADSDGKEPETSRSGVEPAGYVVLLRHGDELMDVQASAKTYLSDEWMKRFNR